MKFVFLPRSGEIPEAIVIELTIDEAKSVELIVNWDFMRLSQKDPHLAKLDEFLRGLKRVIPQ